MSLPNDDQPQPSKLRLGNTEPTRTPPPPPPPANKVTPPPPPANKTTPPPAVDKGPPPPAPKSAVPPGPATSAKSAIPPAVAPSPEPDAAENENRPRPLSIAIAIGTLVALLLIVFGSVYWIFFSPDTADEPSSPAKVASTPTTSTSTTSESAAQSPSPETLGKALETVSEISPEATEFTREIREDTDLVESLSGGNIPPPDATESVSATRLTPSVSVAQEGTKITLAPTALLDSPASNGSPVQLIKFSSDETTGIEAPSFVEIDPELSSFIETVSITGILPAGSESRAIINGDLYMVGDRVSETDLQFVATNAYQLVFQDSRGAIYRRNF